jgi:hypothetical protein
LSWKGLQLSNEGHGKKDIECPSVQGYELAKQDQRLDVQWENEELAVAVVVVVAAVVVVVVALLAYQ